MFEDIEDPSVYLNRDDADFVDIMHTNTYPYDEDARLPYEAPEGDVDIYPHNGGRQPPCEIPSKHCGNTNSTVRYTEEHIHIDLYN